MLSQTCQYLTQHPYPAFTPDQIERARKGFIARENARNSTGPVTAEGKARVALNARKHGFSGTSIVIEDEDRIQFDQHLDAYLESFRPETQAECDQVRKVAFFVWRHDRLCRVEAGLLDLDIVHRKPLIDAYLDNVQERHILAICFLELTNSDNALELCRRYMSQASRDADRAIQTFYMMQRERYLQQQRKASIPASGETPQNQSVPNKPTPIRAEMPQPGRNSLCPYGSGLKFKRCCLGKVASNQQMAA